eukprot:TRINITY_DN106355_c0_g1_i1.p1 TRINITY_DN106355_c0_g1~~TRINITY_DN106355_c0_g1_i1.p1  ORF type:complete len:288 (-),score=48.40 TRINITY_DN106355_c0_g1_i1:82-891(-)
MGAGACPSRRPPSSDATIETFRGDRTGLNEVLLRYLEGEGVNDDVVGQVKDALEIKEPPAKRRRLDHTADAAFTEAAQDLLRAWEYAVSNSFEISVATLSGNTATFQVCASTSVRDLKAMIEEKLQIPAKSQQLVFEQREMNDGHDMLVKHGIGPFSSLINLIRIDDLRVSSADASVGHIISGTYFVHRERQARLMYRRKERHDGRRIFLYFLQDDTAPNCSGWWFGFHPKKHPHIRSRFAYNVDKSLRPPSSGWTHPHHRAAMDIAIS